MRCIRLAHRFFTGTIVFLENTINVLAVESPKLFAEMVQELLPTANEDETSFVLSENDSIIEISKNLNIITDLFSLEINSKKIITKLYNNLKERAVNEMYTETAEVKAVLNNFLLQLTADGIFGFSFEEDVDVLGILKLCDVKIEETDKTLVEKIIDYLLINSEFLKTKCFVFVNLKSFLDTDELKELYKMVCYNKINILLLESRASDERIEGEVVRIIDKDLCEIY